MTQDRFDPEEVARFENATWSRCAETYSDGFGALVREAVIPLLDEVNVSDGKRVLDVGTGPGLVAAAAAERGADVVGIDFSDAMVAQARRRYPGLDFRKAAGESLPFDAGKFDAVCQPRLRHRRFLHPCTHARCGTVNGGLCGIRPNHGRESPPWSAKCRTGSPAMVPTIWKAGAV